MRSILCAVIVITCIKIQQVAFTLYASCILYIGQTYRYSPEYAFLYLVNNYIYFFFRFSLAIFVYSYS